MGNWGLHFVRPYSKKRLRLTNKQTDSPKDNKACGQTSWWSDSEPEAHIWSLRPLPLSRRTLWRQEKLSHCGRTQWLDSGRSICFQTEPAHSMLFMIHLFEIRYSRRIISSVARRRGMWWPGCERTLWRIVQSFAQPVWSDHSSQAGWCLARSVHSEESGGSLMESGVCVMLGSTEWNGVRGGAGGVWAAALMEDGGGEGDELSKWVPLCPINPLLSLLRTHLHTHTCQSLPYGSHLWAESSIWSKVWTPYSWDRCGSVCVLIRWVGQIDSHVRGAAESLSCLEGIEIRS